MSFYCRLKEIAKLGSDRERRSQQKQALHFQRQQRIRFMRIERKKRRGDGKASQKTPNRARPCLLGPDPGPQLWPADTATGEVSADVGYPNNQENENECDKSLDMVKPHQYRCDLRCRGIEESRRRPAPRLR